MGSLGWGVGGGGGVRGGTVLLHVIYSSTVLGTLWL